MPLENGTSIKLNAWHEAAYPHSKVNVLCTFLTTALTGCQDYKMAKRRKHKVEWEMQCMRKRVLTMTWSDIVDRKACNR